MFGFPLHHILYASCANAGNTLAHGTKLRISMCDCSLRLYTLLEARNSSTGHVSSGKMLKHRPWGFSYELCRDELRGVGFPMSLGDVLPTCSKMALVSEHEPRPGLFLLVLLVGAMPGISLTSIVRAISPENTNDFRQVLLLVLLLLLIPLLLLPLLRYCYCSATPAPSCSCSCSCSCSYSYSYSLKHLGCQVRNSRQLAAGFQPCSCIFEEFPAGSAYGFFCFRLARLQ